MLFCMAVVLLLGGTFLHQRVGRLLNEEFNLLLKDRLEFYKGNTSITGVGGQVSLSMENVDLTEDKWQQLSQKNPDLVQAWFFPSGRDTVQRSPALRGRAMERPAIMAGEILFKDFTWEGKQARLLTTTFSPLQKNGAPPTTVQILVARNYLSVQKTMGRVRLALWVIGGALLGFSSLLVSWLIQRGLQPVKILERQIERVPLVGQEDRFTLPGAPSEMQPVITRLNALMDRVGAAIEHERQFASNAAHELRNPLAGIRSTVEAALNRTRTAEEYEIALECILTIQQGMQRLVDNLLLLARLESGHTHSDFVSVPFDLLRTLKRAYGDHMDLAAEKGLKTTWDLTDPGAPLPLTGSLMEITVRNMISNAIHYTPPKGQIKIKAAATATHCTVSVENTVQGLDPADMEKTFAPFWRGDPNASGHRGNAGIGLALCRRIAETMKGTMTGEHLGETVRYTMHVPLLSSSPTPTTAPIPLGPSEPSPHSRIIS